MIILPRTLSTALLQEVTSQDMPSVLCDVTACSVTRRLGHDSYPLPQRPVLSQADTPPICIPSKRIMSCFHSKPVSKPACLHQGAVIQMIRLTCSWCFQGGGPRRGQLAGETAQALLQDPHLRDTSNAQLRARDTK